MFGNPFDALAFDGGQRAHAGDRSQPRGRQGLGEALQIREGYAGEGHLLATRTFGKEHSVVFGSLWHPFLANSLRAHRLWETRCREDRFRIALLVSLR